MCPGSKREENLDKLVETKSRDMRNDMSDYSVIIYSCKPGLKLLNVASLILI